MARGFFGTVINNIRTLLAVSIVAYGFYKEFFKNESIIKALPYYIVASLFHVMGIALFLIRMTYLFFENVQSLSKKLRNIILFLFLSGAIYAFGSRFINVFLSKVESYTTGEDFFYIWEFIITILYLGLTIYMIKLHRKSIKIAYCQEDSHHCDMDTKKRFSNFMIYIILFEILFAFTEYNIFFRTGFVLSILNVPLYLDIMYNMEKCKAYNNIRIINKNLKFLFSVILLIECARGNLCSLKFFE
jgi:hypothetical protein